MTMHIEQVGQLMESFPLLAPPRTAAPAPAPTPNEVWQLPGGTAWVYYGVRHSGLVRPVILSDGYNLGPSELDPLWDSLEHRNFPFATELLRRGQDLIILGFDDRSASIMRNAEAAIATIQRAKTERQSDERLVVGGFSMGGLVTRYALAKMEADRQDHQTSIYLSFDTPHRGAWVPIGLQALAHFLRRAFVTGPSEQINSPAARQLLWRHISDVDGVPAPDPMRTEFLDALRRVGSWPNMPRKLGVANGNGDGYGNGLPADVPAVEVTAGLFAKTLLQTQSCGDERLVARLRLGLPGGTPVERLIHTSGVAELDGAPGGTLESFGIAGEALRKALNVTTVHHRSVCFVPAVSAVAIRDLDLQDDVYVDVRGLPPEQSELDEFALADTNQEHCGMSEELALWILDRLA